VILFLLVCIPFAGGLIAWAMARVHVRAPQSIALATLFVDLGFTIWLWASRRLALGEQGAWLAQVQIPWIPGIGVSVHFALDGISLLLILLTLVLAIMAVIIPSSEVHDRPGFFLFNLMWTVSAMVAVFIAMDLFLFYVAWELMIVPMYFIIALWGSEKRARAGMKFFIFTQASSLLLLIAILGLYFIHGNQTAAYTFDYASLLHTTLSPHAGFWLMLGFFLAFAVKLGAFPLHGWLPDAYSQAPMAGSLLLAGVMAKTGAYGLIRFCLPLFPNASSSFSGVAMILGSVAIIYGALMALGQTDLKRIIAYASVSHMGLVLLGIYVWNQLSLQGAMIQMVSHGVAVGALFIIAALLENRIGSRDIRHFGGLWHSSPKLGGFTLVFALALMGLPGLGTFVGELLIVLAAFKLSAMLAVIPLAGTVFAVVYALWMMQKIFMGEPIARRMPDCRGGELVSLAVLTVLIVWLGLFPTLFLNASEKAVSGVLEKAPDARPDFNASLNRFSRVSP
jgi:NADH-quinone oxidoreductase subunit M